MPRQPRRFDEENVAADRSPGESGCDPGHARAARDLTLEARGAEHRVDVGRIEGHTGGLPLGNLYGGVAQQGADLTLETADPRLAGVLPYHARQCRIGDVNLRGVEAVRLQLA